VHILRSFEDLLPGSTSLKFTGIAPSSWPSQGVPLVTAAPLAAYISCSNLRSGQQVSKGAVSSPKPTHSISQFNESADIKSFINNEIHQDAADSKSRVPKGTYRFNSGPGHHLTLALTSRNPKLVSRRCQFERGARRRFLVLRELLSDPHILTAQWRIS
jgi:hypothetical protein